MNFSIVKKTIISIFVTLVIITANGCALGKKGSINYFIEQKKQDPNEIIELICDPGSDSSIRSENYDKLSKLTSLESITFIAIASEEDAQNFFSQLVKLPNLKCVRIESSRIGSISKLAEISKLQELHIIEGTYAGPSYKIDDLEKLGEKGCFTELKILELRNMQCETMPDMSELKNLEEFSISGYDLKKIDYDCLCWSGLTSLDIRSTGIFELDSRIVSELKNLEKLDLSWSKIKDVSFVLEFPKLKEFRFFMHTNNNTNIDVLEKHPNFNESWLYD